MVPADDLPGFPIWVDAWYGRMRKPGRVEGSTSTLRAKRDDAASEEPDWWTDFVTKNKRFYKEHAALLDAWVEKWKVAEFP
jgi:hypothetical protein